MITQFIDQVLFVISNRPVCERTAMHNVKYDLKL
jgi:hypothetical protein